MSLLLLFQSDAGPVPPDVGHRTVTAQLLDYDGTPVAGEPLAEAFDIDWYDEWNGPGRGSCSLALSLAGSAELLPGRYVNCLIDGSVKFTFKIEGNPEYHIIERGEEHEQIIVVAGRGWACTFDEALVYPEAPLDFLVPTSWRLFSFASPSFPNDVTWTAADELYEYLDGVSYGYRYQQAPDGLLYPSPIGFPYPLSSNVYDPLSPPGPDYLPTYWIWPTGEELSLGWAFFRKQITIPTDGAYTFALTGDNYFTIFIEGIPLLGEINEIHCWLGWQEGSIFLEAGTYMVAAVVENPDWPVALNPGGFICDIYALGVNNAPDTLVTASDNSWNSSFVDAGGYWPGWTPGQIIQKLIDEAVARSEMAIYSSDTFTAMDDTDGDEWRPFDPTFDSPYVPSFAINIGTTIMDALMQLNEEGFINWHVQPGTLILDVYRARPPGAPSSAATLAAGVNLVALERNATAPYANRLLVQWGNSQYIVVDDVAAQAAYGTVVNDVYSSDATSEADATRIGETELAKRAQGAFPSIVVGVEPTGAADCPYDAYATGDWVTVPAVGGGTELVRVLSISCRQDDMGYAVWTMELNQKMDVVQKRTNDLLRQIGGRNQIVRGAVS